MKRIAISQYTDVNNGLTASEVRERQKSGRTNKLKKVVGKSYLQIFVSNIFTFFNLLGFIIFFLMLFFGDVSEMTFILVVLANTAIGIFQEIRSKHAVEKLSIVTEPTAEVRRDGNNVRVSTDEVVADDIVLFFAGNQVCADCVVVCGEVEVNESMLSGESVNVKKKYGDVLYRGSFVVSGSCSAQAVNVGKETYIEQLSARVKRAKMPDSQLIKGTSAIIKFIAIVIFPLGFLTYYLHGAIQQLMSDGIGFLQMWQLYFNGDEAVVGAIRSAMQAACGSMVGMVPSGIMLLTSVALAVGALKLAQKKVLVRELSCIEMLARVDTLCLDKTGTITDGSMTVEQVLPLGVDEATLKIWIASVLNATADDNMTAVTLRQYTAGVNPVAVTKSIPFSSARKYSAATLDGVGTVAIGAAEFLFKHIDKEFDRKCEQLLKQGLRVLAVGVSKSEISSDVVEDALPVGIVALSDAVRADAADIIKWFADNDVAVKVISGDNPLSVSIVAEKVGVPFANKYISLEGMTDDEVRVAANNYTVFGRVSPEQKALLVSAIKQNGHTVAMTGDGVNDILAMRESDCAISVGCGTDAAKTVANLVLTDNNFSGMPGVVAEGRQVVNNVQNSTSLFLMKTSMILLVTLTVIVMSLVRLSQGMDTVSFPFRPSNLAALNLFVIGIASFMLALKPNSKRIKGQFLPNTLRTTLPSGIAMYLSVASVYIFGGLLGLQNQNQVTTTAMVAMSFTGVAALWILCWPLDRFNAIVVSVGTIGVIGTLCLFQPLYLWVMRLFSGPSYEMEIPFIVDIPLAAKLFILCDVVAVSGLNIFVKWLLNKFAVKADVK